jgi:hypothetical protein
MTFLAHNLKYFTFNSSIHSISTREGYIQFHRPAANLISYQTSVYYTSKKIFNISPKCIAELVEDKNQFV